MGKWQPNHQPAILLAPCIQPHSECVKSDVSCGDHPILKDAASKRTGFETYNQLQLGTPILVVLSSKKYGCL